MDESAQSIDFDLSESRFDPSALGPTETLKSGLNVALGATGKSRDMGSSKKQGTHPVIHEQPGDDLESMDSHDFGLSESNFSQSLLTSAQLGKSVTNPPFKGSATRERAFTQINKGNNYMRGTDELIEEDFEEDGIDDSNEKKDKL